MQDENSLKEVSEEIIQEMRAWNASNPKARFLDIEVKARELGSPAGSPAHSRECLGT
jgi:hypothetical protein